MRRMALLTFVAAIAAADVEPVLADPCGMVPPIYLGNQAPIARIGDQNTYVFFKDGVETFVIRPGFKGKVDEFGMLIPLPSVPALRKVSDNIFPHVRAAIDPPEVVVYANRRRFLKGFARNRSSAPANYSKLSFAEEKQKVRVVKEEAVGMYEVAVLEAGSSAALKKWMDEHGYKYPKGMDKACDDYVRIGWCFVAVKTKVAQKKGVNPKPGMRKVNSKLPAGSTFDGHVQAMGFRFKTNKLVVPMRLSTFNDGDLHNIVYVLSDEPQKIRSVPEEYVVRQISGSDLFRNVTGPLPLRIIGGQVKDIPASQKRNLKQRRNPVPHNGAARDLFAADLLAIQEKRLTHPHEEKEKMFLRIGEKLGLRGPEIDKLNEGALVDDREKAVKTALKAIEPMTLTVIDGNFPREVLANQNLTFANYKMPSRRNSSRFYDARTKKPAGAQQGFRTLGVVSQADVIESGNVKEARLLSKAGLLGALLSFGAIGMVLTWLSRKRRKVVVGMLIAATFAAAQSEPVLADPCGMVPPIYLGNQAPIARIGDQNTYVFFKDGVETFVIRPGFKGKVDEFGMLIPLPTVPALRKVSDNIFPHVRAAVDPPEVVIDLRFRRFRGRRFKTAKTKAPAKAIDNLAFDKRREVRVVKEEAVGMYEVAVLEAGSSAALKKWMDEHGYKFPKGMDKACDDYVRIGWCFVAVKTKVGQKKGVNPKPGMRKVNSKLPTGSTFDGHVQAMGFRFKTNKLVVPMRLSTFNGGDLHNIVYVLSDEPQKIRSVPEEYVVRQIPGSDLFRNVTGPLPLRVIGGQVKDIPVFQKRNLKQRRNPVPHNGAARDLFAADLLAIQEKRLTHPHEEKEKMFLRIGEKLGLRGPEIDKLNEGALVDDREKAVKSALKAIEPMTLTVVDGNFPREVLANQNLTFANYKMPSRRNSSQFYDARTKKPTAAQQGFRTLGVVSQAEIVEPLNHATREEARLLSKAGLLGALLSFGGIGMVVMWLSRKRRAC